MKTALSFQVILASLVTSALFVWLVQPIGELLYAWLSTSSSEIANNINDVIYKSAAAEHPVATILALSAFIYSIVAFACMNFAAVVIGKAVDYARSPLIENMNDITLEQKQEKIAQLELLLKKLKRNGRNVSIAFAVILIVGTIFIYGVAQIYAAEARIISNFNQRIAILSPFLDDMQEKQLRARWALMKGRDDYQALIASISQLENAHDIEPPAPLF